MGGGGGCHREKFCARHSSSQRIKINVEAAIPVRVTEKHGK